jgi:DNA-binding HxlR family transcriptional regulator
MTDYNKRFKELHQKITQVVKDKNITNSVIQKYDNRLNKIEDNSLKKLSQLEKSYSLLKEEFSKIVSLYNNIKNSEKKPLNDKEMNLLIQNLNINLRNEKNEMSDYIKSVFSEIERTINKINENNISQKIKFSNDCDLMKETIDNNSNNFEYILQNQNNKIAQILEDMREGTEKEFENVNRIIEEEINKHDFNSNQLGKNLNELNNKIDEEFQKSKQSSNEFEENIFNLIEETCMKVAEPY